ncbi:MAG: cytochrome d ubiquinol oxidase subunit II [Micrococcales bacterium]|nr:cytochrome d ubiquinol oxidase subunit II [Micrococcales bacterium]
MFIETFAGAAVVAEPLDTGTAAGALIRLLHGLTASPTTLQLLWFGLIAVLWIGYLVLEGFDFGVGMLLPILGKKNNERRAMLSSIGPFWDGNEVWLLTAGGATFAAFPEWYATLFSAAYLPLFLILMGLIVRAVAMEYRGKINSPGWRKLWDGCIIFGSYLPTFLWGVAFTILVVGVKAAVNPAQLGPTKILYDGTFWDLVFTGNGLALLGGVCLVAQFLTHGALFTALKTEGDLRARAEKLAPKLAIVGTVLAAAWGLWLVTMYTNNKAFTWIVFIVAAVALVLVILTSMAKKFGLSFTFMTVALASVVVFIFGGLFPNVINAQKVTIRGGDLLTDPVLAAVIYPPLLENVDGDTAQAIADGLGVGVEDVVAVVQGGGAKLDGWSEDDIGKLIGDDGNLLGDGADITKLITNNLSSLDAVIGNANVVLGEGGLGVEGFLGQLELAPDDAKAKYDGLDGAEHTGFAPIDGTITGLPIAASSSTPTTLKLMTIVACIMTPIVLLYQAWSIITFKRRVNPERIPEDTGLEPAKK